MRVTRGPCRACTCSLPSSDAAASCTVPLVSCTSLTSANFVSDATKTQAVGDADACLCKKSRPVWAVHVHTDILVEEGKTRGSPLPIFKATMAAASGVDNALKHSHITPAKQDLSALVLNEHKSAGKAGVEL